MPTGTALPGLQSTGVSEALGVASEAVDAVAASGLAGGGVVVGAEGFAVAEVLTTAYVPSGNWTRDICSP